MNLIINRGFDCPDLTGFVIDDRVLAISAWLTAMWQDHDRRQRVIKASGIKLD